MDLLELLAVYAIPILSIVGAAQVLVQSLIPVSEKFLQWAETTEAKWDNRAAKWLAVFLLQLSRLLDLLASALSLLTLRRLRRK